MARPWWKASFALALVGCSWSRFSDVGSNPPVVLLTEPDKMNGGFGVALATANAGNQTELLVGGSPGAHRAALFPLGTGTSPDTDATDLGSCSQDTPCYFANQVAALGTANDGSATPDQLCFVLGFGQAAGAAEYGLTVRCVDGVEYTLPVPDSVLTEVIRNDLLFQDSGNPPPPLVLAADKDETPALIAGASTHQLAWYYQPGGFKALELTPPGKADADFGAAVAIMRQHVVVADAGADSTGSRIAAVGAPGEGHVWLFRGEDGAPLGCLGGPSQFGRTLASGRVDGDDIDDLVVADATNVTVFSGAALANLTPTTDATCSLGALPPDAVIASFGCGSRDTVAGCPGGFAAALDVGDLDGDGDGEVIVGAPEMKVRGTNRAGAVLVYDAEGANPDLLTDQLFLSSQGDGDELGAAVVAAHIEGRDVVVAGAPGNARTAIFYCSVLLPHGAGGSRCQ